MHYNPALDGVRAVAVFAVVFFHCDVLSGGFIGVDVFFVLSGFLITTLLRSELQETGRIGLGRFYWRRALRLWPALLLMLSAYAVFAPDFLADTVVWRDVLLSGFYLSDYSQAFWRVPENLGHTWSLAVEEHFYLLWPLVIIGCGSMTNRRASLVFGGAFLLATLWRCFDLFTWLSWGRTYFRFDTRLSGLLIGALVAVLPWRPKTHTSSNAIAGIGLAVLALALVTFEWRTLSPLTIGLSVTELAAAALVVSLIGDRQSVVAKALAWRPVVYVGLLSYSIYLWHYPIARALRDQFEPAVTVTVVSALSLLIAALSYEFVEKPIRRYRNRPAAQPA